MQVIEITFHVYDTKKGRETGLSISHMYSLQEVAQQRSFIGSVILDRFQRFWTSVVLMGVLDK